MLPTLASSSSRSVFCSMCSYKITYPNFVFCSRLVTLYFSLHKLHKLFIKVLVHSGNLNLNILSPSFVLIAFTLSKMSPLAGCIAFSSWQKPCLKYVLVLMSQQIPFCWHSSLILDVNTLLIYVVAFCTRIAQVQITNRRCKAARSRLSHGRVS